MFHLSSNEALQGLVFVEICSGNALPRLVFDQFPGVGQRLIMSVPSLIAGSAHGLKLGLSVLSD